MVMNSDTSLFSFRRLRRFSVNLLDSSRGKDTCKITGYPLDPYIA